MTTELIYTLDPTRDYGDRSYDQVVTEIESGALMVIPSAKGGQPIIRQKVVRAQKLFMELYVGRPTEAVDGMDKDIAKIIAEHYLRSQGTRTVDLLDV